VSTYPTVRKISTQSRQAKTDRLHTISIQPSYLALQVLDGFLADATEQKLARTNDWQAFYTLSNSWVASIGQVGTG
jgi:hypothetical protein